jgi:hypothetical protein
MYIILQLNIRSWKKYRIKAAAKEAILVTQDIKEIYNINLWNYSVVISRRFRIFNVIDNNNRKLLATEIDF